MNTLIGILAILAGLTWGLEPDWAKTAFKANPTTDGKNTAVVIGPGTAVTGNNNVIINNPTNVNVIIYYNLSEELIKVLKENAALKVKEIGQKLGEAVAKQSVATPDDRELQAVLQALKSGDSEKAITYFTQKRAAERTEQQKNDQAYAQTALNLGRANFVALKFEPALAELREAHQLDPTSFEIVYVLDSALQMLGKYPEALALSQSFLPVHIAKVGKDHREVAALHTQIGIAFFRLGKLPEAIEHHQASLQISLKLDGPNSANVATAYNNLGNVYNSQGKYEQAIEYYQKDLKITLATLGENHPNTAGSYNNLGAVYSSQGKYEQAIEQLQKALNIKLATLGENHPSTAASHNNLGDVYNSQGKYDQAIEAFQQGLNIHLATLGENHPSTATSYNNLGVSYKNLKRFDEAQTHYQKALAIFEAMLPPNHPDIQRTRNNLAQLTQARATANKKEP